MSASLARLAAVLSMLAAAPVAGLADERDEEWKPLPTVTERVAGARVLDGFLPLYHHEPSGKLWMAIPSLGEEVLYYASLPAGIGSNDIGLDRGQIGDPKVVRFDRVGPRVLLVQPNKAYRAGTDNPAERKAVRDSFAESVLFGFEVVAEEDGRVLVDATPFVLRDAHGVAGTLRRTGQGTFTLDASRSALYPDRTRVFPENTEIEATLTFTLASGEEPGAWLRTVAPDPRTVTVRQHHSFVRLPDDRYRPRENDPRSGYFGVSYRDYAASLGAPMERRLLARHRLERRDPSNPSGPAVEPIVYYLDPGTPEPVRSALLDGARWWEEAFRKAGYTDGFRVEMLPEGADPMDIRYNVIQWVHRSTRGWSYGNAIMDPRTGEILKGQVSLGSLRVRQDYLIAEGLLAPYENGEEADPRLAEMALARIRQLSAHEVGHTLGLGHNYIASAQGPDGRSSVMDYPHPLTRLRDDGTVDLASAYDEGVGEWDEVAVAYGYSDFPEGTDEEAALEGILEDARERGLWYITDKDARPRGGAHPRAHLWDNAPDAAAELERVMDVRAAALARFGERAIRSGRPMATLEEVLVPVYLHHRYQMEAAVKLVGGVDYVYAFRGDGQEPQRPVPRETQARALRAVLRTLDPAELALPRDVIAALPPRPALVDPHRELFDRRTGPTFDPLSPAEAAADLSVSLLLDPQRAARLVAQHALDPELPGLGDVIGRLVETAFAGAETDPYRDEVAGAVQWVVVRHLRRLATGAPAHPVRAEADQALRNLREQLLATAVERPDDAWSRYLVEELGRHLDRRAEPAPMPPPVEAPPGSPIG